MTNKSKVMLIDSLINDLRRNYPDWPSTFSQCMNEGCVNGARGGRQCIECIFNELMELTGNDSHVEILHEHIYRASRARNTLILRAKEKVAK